MNTIHPSRSFNNVLIRCFSLICSLISSLTICERAYSLTIIPTFDSTITSDPQAATIEATINAAIAVYASAFSDPVTVAITFHKKNDGLGSSSTFYETFSYLAYRAALLSHLTTADDATALAHLPNSAGNPVNNNPNVNVNLALARTLGLTSDTETADSTISLNISICNLSAAQTDTTKYSLFAVVSHEIDEALGFASSLNNLTNGAASPTGPISPQDLFRYGQNSVRSFTTDPNAASYFSLDGTTLLARFNQSQYGDFGDWFGPTGQTPPEVQDAFGTLGATPVLGVELRVLDAIGYSRTPVPVWVQYGLGDLGNGTYARPYNTLARGTDAVQIGGTILFKYPGSTPEKPSLSKPMTIGAVGGPATIGN